MEVRREIGSRTTSQVSSVACPAPSKGDGEAQLLPLGPMHPTSWTQGLAKRVLCVFICKRVAPVMLYLSGLLPELVLCSSLGGSGHIWGTSSLCWVCGFSPNSPFLLLLARLVLEQPELWVRAGSSPSPGCHLRCCSPQCVGQTDPHQRCCTELYRGGLWV